MSEKRQCCDTTITRIAMNVTFQLLSAICGALMASVGVLRFISLPALGNSGAFQATVPGVIIAVWVIIFGLMSLLFAFIFPLIFQSVFGFYGIYLGRGIFFGFVGVLMLNNAWFDIVSAVLVIVFGIVLIVFAVINWFLPLDKRYFGLCVPLIPLGVKPNYSGAQETQP